MCVPSSLGQQRADPALILQLLPLQLAPRNMHSSSGAAGSADPSGSSHAADAGVMDHSFEMVPSEDEGNDGMGPALPEQPKNLKMEVSDLKACMQVHPDTNQRNQFMAIEVAMRMRNSEATPFEKHAIRSHQWNNDKLKDDAQKVLQLFGQTKGAGRSSKNVIGIMANGQGLRLGDLVEPDCILWTMCKHLWVSQIKSLAPPLMVANEDGRGPSVLCYCLPASVFMPMGCCNFHFKGPIFKNDHPYVKIGYPCSKCLRCGG